MFTIDVNGRDPIYIQLEKNIIRYINLGVYEKDSMLPSVRSLACRLGINPNTVAKAYKSLEAGGVIYTKAGKGVFVKGGATGLEQVQKSAVAKAKAALSDAKNSGVPKESVLAILNDLWEE